MTPTVQHFIARLRDLFAGLWAAVRRRPLIAIGVLPALALAYVLALLPFTPATSNLRKARIEAPATLMSADGVVLATYQRVHRVWVPLDKVSPSVVQALIATED